MPEPYASIARHRRQASTRSSSRNALRSFAVPGQTSPPMVQQLASRTAGGTARLMSPCAQGPSRQESSRQLSLQSSSPAHSYSRRGLAASPRHRRREVLLRHVPEAAGQQRQADHAPCGRCQWCEYLVMRWRADIHPARHRSAP